VCVVYVVSPKRKKPSFSFSFSVSFSLVRVMSAPGSFYTDSGILNGAFVIDPVFHTVLHVVQPGWRHGKVVVDDQTTKWCNSIMKQYTLEQLIQMSGNKALNSTVHSMNVWRKVP